MKKPMVVLTAIAFFFAFLTASFAGGPVAIGFHGHRIHAAGGNQFWLGLGLGVMTAALISGAFYQPAPPPIYPEPMPETYRPETMPSAAAIVRVAVVLLNVRSGPGLDQPVITTVRLGDPLEVIRPSADWHLIRTSQGIQGWVMEKYTVAAYPQG